MMDKKIKWLTNAAFEITAGDTTVTMDPSVRFMAYKGLDENSYRKPDYVLITHIHFDHISEFRHLYSTYRPTVVTGALSRRELIRYVDGDAADFYPVYPETELDFGDIRIKALYAIHKGQGAPLSKQVSACIEPSRLIDEDMETLQETGSLEMMNYLVTLPDGYRILIWGGEHSRMQENYLRNLRPDLALMQFTSSQRDRFLSMVEALKPKKVIPYHHDFSKTREKWLPILEETRRSCPEMVIMDNEEEISL